MNNVIIATHACDYGLLPDGSQDGVTLGRHSRVRIDKAVEEARRLASEGHTVQFLFGAGRHKAEHRLLHELQAEYLSQCLKLGAVGTGIRQPREGECVWGSEEELRYFWKVAQQRRSELVVVSEDYHKLRLRLLCHLNRIPARIVVASSEDYPLDWEEWWHEQLSIAARVILPQRLRHWIRALDRRRRRARYGLG